MDDYNEYRVGALRERRVLLDSNTCCIILTLLIDRWMMSRTPLEISSHDELMHVAELAADFVD